MKLKENCKKFREVKPGCFIIVKHKFNSFEKIHFSIFAIHEQFRNAKSGNKNAAGLLCCINVRMPAFTYRC